ncbi:unnamed protein product, partial [Discosporangium mesarthrocarpum]
SICAQLRRSQREGPDMPCKTSRSRRPRSTVVVIASVCLCGPRKVAGLTLQRYVPITRSRFTHGGCSCSPPSLSLDYPVRKFSREFPVNQNGQGRRAPESRLPLSTLMSSDPWAFGTGLEGGSGHASGGELDGVTSKNGNNGSKVIGDSGGGSGRGSSSGVHMGSPEFVNLVQAQFDVLASMLGASQIVLFFRRENTESGALEFVPVMVYPEKQRVWVMDDKGIEVKEGPRELPWSAKANHFLPQYPFIS